MRLRVSPGPQARQCRMSKIHDAELQYLTVAYAKTVGIDADGRVVTFDPDRISREAAKLSPLLIYSLAAPCYGVMYRQLVDRRAPVALGQFLAGVWAIEDGLGMPLRLELPAKLLALDREALQRAKTRYATVVRDAAGLDELGGQLTGARGTAMSDRAAVEDAALTVTASAVTAAAVARAESRGCHHRSDRPDRDPAFGVSIDVRLDAAGRAVAALPMGVGN